MRIFKITKELEVVCKSESTRYGFRHLATLFRNGIEIQDGKRTYQNRTWESYEFQSVLNEVIEKAFKIVLNWGITEEANKDCEDRDYFCEDSNDYCFKGDCIFCPDGSYLFEDGECYYKGTKEKPYG